MVRFSHFSIEFDLHFLTPALQLPMHLAHLVLQQHVILPQLIKDSHLQSNLTTYTLQLY